MLAALLASLLALSDQSLLLSGIEGDPAPHHEGETSAGKASDADYDGRVDDFQWSLPESLFAPYSPGAGAPRVLGPCLL
eukprot:15398543-Heterocapsa_arctica.AAC.1